MLPRTPDPESEKATTTPNPTQDDSVLDHRVADPLGTIPMLDEAGCIDETWTPGSILPQMQHNLDLISPPDEIRNVMTEVGKQGAAAWWKGSFSTSLKEALSLGGLSSKRVNSTMAGLNAAHTTGWTNLPGMQSILQC